MGPRPSVLHGCARPPDDRLPAVLLRISFPFPQVAFSMRGRMLRENSPKSVIHYEHDVDTEEEYEAFGAVSAA